MSRGKTFYDREAANFPAQSDHPDVPIDKTKRGRFLNFETVPMIRHVLKALEPTQRLSASAMTQNFKVSVAGDSGGRSCIPPTQRHLQVQ